jgi:hypothetical protein
MCMIGRTTSYIIYNGIFVFFFPTSLDINLYGKKGGI